MAFYLVQVAYTAEAWATLVRQPQDRIEAVKPAVEQLDGTIVAGWLSFGEYDLVAIAELPDNVAAAALSIAFSAGGSCRAVKTTPLMSMAEGVAAMEKAAASTYQPASA